jgi:hypothetical protein
MILGENRSSNTRQKIEIHVTKSGREKKEHSLA